MMSPEPAFTTSALIPVAFSNSGISRSTMLAVVRGVDAHALLRGGRHAEGAPMTIENSARRILLMVNPPE
jgi:hypothetical protein